MQWLLPFGFWAGKVIAAEQVENKPSADGLSQVRDKSTRKAIIPQVFAGLLFFFCVVGAHLHFGEDIRHGNVDLKLLEEGGREKVQSWELFEGCSAKPHLQFLEVSQGEKNPSQVHPQCVDPHELSSSPTTGFLDVSGKGICCDTQPSNAVVDCTKAGSDATKHCCSSGGGKIVCPSTWGVWSAQDLSCSCNRTACSAGGGTCQSDICRCNVWQEWDPSLNANKGGCKCVDSYCKTYAGAARCSSDGSKCECDDGDWNAVEGRCSLTFPLYKASVQTGKLTTTSCPVKSGDCAGCAEFDADRNRCISLRGGFRKRAESVGVERHVACQSVPYWMDASGRSCDHPNVLCNSTQPSNGLTPAQACCKCPSGGIIQATPFVYISAPVAVDFPKVSGWPQPRTATSYTINSDCELPQYGLTIDGSTGQLQGFPKTDEPARIECTITALQLECKQAAAGGGAPSCKVVESPHTAPLIVEIGYLAYQSTTLICYKGGDSYSPILSGHDTDEIEWSDFQVTCVPDLPWMTGSSGGSANGGFNLTSGTITCPANVQSDMIGGVTNVNDVWLNQGGGVCTVRAKQRNRGDPNSSAPKIRTTTVIVVRPMPWEELIYSQYSASATVGEVSPVLKAQPPADGAGAGSMAPATYIADCLVSPSKVGKVGVEEHLTFSFDEMTNTGLVAGFPVFEIGEDGSITALPAEGLLGIFNLDIRTRVRKTIDLTCDVFGLYPDAAINQRYTSGALKSKERIKLSLSDNMCWVKQSLAVSPWGQTLSNTNEAGCRAACRASPMCAMYAVSSSDDCRFYYRKTDQSSGSKTIVTAKITQCTNDLSCLSLSVQDQWLTSGSYCPVGVDGMRGMVYQKQGVTELENIWLGRYLSSRDASDDALDGSTCANEDWVLRRASFDDFIDEENEVYDLKGAIIKCLKKSAVDDIFGSDLKVELQPAGAAKTIEGQFAAKTCGPLNLTNQGDEMSVAVFQLDDKDTLAKADYWLHPCQCIPPAWKAHSPVSAEAIGQVPPGSGNEFVPSAFKISTGSLVCDMEHMLHIHYQSTLEMKDPLFCENLCAEWVGAGETCIFFFSGVQNDMGVCRLYKGCDAIVREFGMRGDLLHYPRESGGKFCAIAEPEKCWSETQRRRFLTETQKFTCMLHASCPKGYEHVGRFATCGPGTKKEHCSQETCCRPCPSGYFKSNAGGADARCQQCPGGMVSGTAADKCVPCQYPAVLSSSQGTCVEPKYKLLVEIQMGPKPTDNGDVTLDFYGCNKDGRRKASSFSSHRTGPINKGLLLSKEFLLDHMVCGVEVKPAINIGFHIANLKLQVKDTSGNDMGCFTPIINKGDRNDGYDLYQMTGDGNSSWIANKLNAQDRPTVGCYNNKGWDYRGTAASTASGIACARWDSHDGHIKSNETPGEGLEDNNYCRSIFKDSGSTQPWCYRSRASSRDDKKWEFCSVPKCDHKVLDFYPSENCFQLTTDECQETDCQLSSDYGASYRGNISKTDSGKTCQNWNAKTRRIDSDFKHESHNFCRKADSSNFIWCYTADKWGKCSVPVCSQSVENTGCYTGRGHDYRGPASVTKSGVECQRWDAQTPRRHSYNPSAFPGEGLQGGKDSNTGYCRNPILNGEIEPQPWCYTKSGSNKWEHCNVPKCFTVSKGCSQHYGEKSLNVPCCGGSAPPADLGSATQCPRHLPYCSGYVPGETWGKCSKFEPVWWDENNYAKFEANPDAAAAILFPGLTGRIFEMQNAKTCTACKLDGANCVDNCMCSMPEYTINIEFEADQSLTLGVEYSVFGCSANNDVSSAVIAKGDTGSTSRERRWHKDEGMVTANVGRVAVPLLELGCGVKLSTVSKTVQLSYVQIGIQRGSNFVFRPTTQTKVTIGTGGTTYKFKAAQTCESCASWACDPMCKISENANVDWGNFVSKEKDTSRLAIRVTLSSCQISGQSSFTGSLTSSQKANVQAKLYDIHGNIQSADLQYGDAIIPTIARPSMIELCGLTGTIWTPTRATVRMVDKSGATIFCKDMFDTQLFLAKNQCQRFTMGGSSFYLNARVRQGGQTMYAQVKSCDDARDNKFIGCEWGERFIFSNGAEEGAVITRLIHIDKRLLAAVKLEPDTEQLQVQSGGVMKLGKVWTTGCFDADLQTDVNSPTIHLFPHVLPVSSAYTAFDKGGQYIRGSSTQGREAALPGPSREVSPSSTTCPSSGSGSNLLEQADAEPELFLMQVDAKGSTDELSAAAPLSFQKVFKQRQQQVMSTEYKALLASENARQSLQETNSEIPSIKFQHLYDMCDLFLLLGGVGVDECYRPQYADPASHDWKNKRLVEKEYSHGDIFGVSCWDERFAGASAAGVSVATTDAVCVDGTWYSGTWQTRNKAYPGLSGFQCGSCLQAVPPEYEIFDEQNRQELMFLNHMQISLWADLGLWNEELRKIVSEPTCLQMTVSVADDGTRTPLDFVPVAASPDAPCTRLLVKTSTNFPENRKQFQIVNADPYADFLVGNTKLESKTIPKKLYCLQSHPVKHVVAAECKDDIDTQFIQTSALPTLLWNALQAREKRRSEGSNHEFTAPTTSLHELSGQIDCGSMGAITELAFQPTGSRCAMAVNIKRKPKKLLPWKGSISVGVTAWSKEKVGKVKCTYTAAKAAYRGQTIQYMVNDESAAEARPVGVPVQSKGGKSDELVLSYEGAGPFNKVIIENMGSEPWCIGDILIEGAEPGKTLNINEKPSSDDGMLIGAGDQIVITGQRWKQELANVNLDCGDGHAISFLEITEKGVEHQCSSIGGLGSCRPWITERKDVKSGGGIQALADMRIKCEEGEVLRSFVFEFEENMANWRVQCCETGSVPIVFEPVRLDRSTFKTYEGVYCPTRVTEYGRMEYKQRDTSASLPRYRWTPSTFSPTISFDEDTGEWCAKMQAQNTSSLQQYIGDAAVTSKTWFCMKYEEALPVGLYGADVGFTLVTPFDGVYTASGATTGSKSEEVLEEQIPPMPTAPPMVKQPKKIKPHKMTVFDPEGPKYDGVCKMDDQKLNFLHNQKEWDGMKWQSASGENGVPLDFDKEVPRDKKGGGLSKLHPCSESRREKYYPDFLYGSYPSEARRTGFTSGFEDPPYSPNEQSSQPTYGVRPDNIFNCRQRSKNRKKLILDASMIAANLINAIRLINVQTDPACDVVEPEMAPGGIGVGTPTAALCEDVKAAAAKSAELYTKQATMFTKSTIMTSDEQDCDYIHNGLAMTMCDIYCVRDAVVRGDYVINQNIKAASDILNHNLEHLSKWGVDSMNSQTDWLGDKMDYLDQKLKYYHDLEKVDRVKERSTHTKAIAAAVKAGTLLQMDEVQKFADSTVLSSSANAHAHRAVISFLSSNATQTRFSETPDVAHLIQFLQNFDTLHSTLKHTASVHGQTHVRMAPRVLQTRMHHLRTEMEQQLSLLGVYKSHMSESGARQRQKSTIDSSSVHMSMNDIWWNIRRAMDDYLTSADKQFQTYDSTLTLLESYQSCKVSISKLQNAYEEQHEARQKSIELLQKTFRDLSYDAGRLASVMEDGGVFSECDRAAANAQMFNAVSIAALVLIERHRDVGLPEPDLSLLRDAHRRVGEAWKLGKERCKSGVNLIQVSKEFAVEKMQVAEEFQGRLDAMEKRLAENDKDRLSALEANLIKTFKEEHRQVADEEEQHWYNPMSWFHHDHDESLK